jgi:hypothetical protein
MDPEETETLSSLLQEFLIVARSKDNPIHLLRALSLEAAFFAQQGDIERALKGQQELEQIYKIQQHSEEWLSCIVKTMLWNAGPRAFFDIPLLGTWTTHHGSPTFLFANTYPIKIQRTLIV